MAWQEIKDETGTVIYKGFQIVPCPLETETDDHGRGKWTVSVKIRRMGTEKWQHFSAKGQSASTEQEAIQLSITYGQDEIDKTAKGR